MKINELRRLIRNIIEANLNQNNQIINQLPNKTQTDPTIQAQIDRLNLDIQKLDAQLINKNKKFQDDQNKLNNSKVPLDRLNLQIANKRKQIADLQNK